MKTRRAAPVVAGTRSPVRRSAALALGGLLTGLLAVAPAIPAGAADGTQVLVYETNSLLPYSYAQLGTAVGLPVQETTTFPSDLSSYACVVLAANPAPFDAASTASLADYVHSGGNLIASGDNSVHFSNANSTMNQLSSSLGAGMSLTSQSIDSGFNVTNQIDPTPLTVGVSSVVYGATTGVAVNVSGAGRSLVRTKADGGAPSTTFIAAERVGAGTFVLMGDNNVLSDVSNDGYTAHDNGVLARNLCLGSLVEYRIDGFFGPVDTGIVNTVKGGATVPLQFRVYELEAEVTDPAVVDSFTAQRVTCPDEASATDEVEVTLSGSTSLRYTDGKFLQLWKTPKVPGCYEATITTTDGTGLTVDFRLR